MALKTTARDIGLGFVGVALGAGLAFVIGGPKTKFVPPPAFTGASFGNSAPKRTLVSAKVHYWTDPKKAPKDDPARKDFTNWAGNTAIPLEPRPKAPQFAATADYIDTSKTQDIVTMALVVIVLNSDSAKQETYINFLLNEANQPTDPEAFGIHHMNAWLTNEEPPKLVVDYFHGNNTVVYPNAKITDDSFFGP